MTLGLAKRFKKMSLTGLLLNDPKRKALLKLDVVMVCNSCIDDVIA